MVRKVKCRICGNYGTNETFYRITDEKGRNKYYCNREEYENYINEQNKRYNLLKYIAEEVFELEEGQIVHPLLVKKIGEWNKFYDYEVIHECFYKNKEMIQYWIRVKDFSSEYGMISYIIKIIEGNINDVYKEWKRKKEQEIKMENNGIDIDINILEKLENEKVINEIDNGILSFLDEEDL